MDKSSLMYPMFVMEGENKEEEIPSMTGQYRYSLDRLPYKLEQLSIAGVGSVMFFGSPDHKDEVGPDTRIVCELSCHQLEYMTVSPHIAILTNLHEEHLDHYGTLEKYVQAKRHIYSNQKEGDVLVCNVQCLPKKGTCTSKLIAAKPSFEVSLF